MIIGVIPRVSIATMWSPFDYAAQGDLCPLDDLRAYVAQVRARLGVPLLVLLAANERAAVGPLALASGETEQLESVAMAWLRDYLAVNARAIVELAFSSGAKLPEIPASVQAAHANLGAGVHAIHLPIDIDRARVRPRVIGYSNRDSATRLSLTRHEAQQILAMVNATPQAIATLDEAVMSDVDECMVPKLDENGIIKFRTMARGVADLAVRVTRGERAAVYMRAPGPDTQPSLLAESVAATSVSSPVEQAVQHLLVHVLETHQAEQVENPEWTELATPIPGGFASPQASAIGVLWICRRGKQSFSAYDLALARNMCLRLAVLHSTAIAGRIARGITELRSTSVAEVAAHITPLQHDDEELPPDVELAIARVPSALKTIARDTNSHSVTIRVALPDPDAGSPHGLALRRVAAYPPDRLNDPYQMLHHQDGGINWQVARDNRVVYLPDITTPDHGQDYLAAREGTRSELALPIRSEGRLIGTLNLESSSRLNYGPLIPQAMALAGAMGRSFADAQAYYTQPVLERAAQLLDHGHDYESHLRALRRSPTLTGLSHQDRAKIEEEIEKGLALITDITRGDNENAAAEQRSTIWDTFKDACEDLKPMVLEQPDWDNRPEWDRLLLPNEQRLICSALRNVLINLKRYAGSPPLGGVYKAPNVSDTTCTWAGSEYIALTIRNSSSKFITKRVANRAYRVPFPGIDGKLRLGSYLAALRLRQISGLASFSVTDSGWSCRTTLLIPKYPEVR